MCRRRVRRLTQGLPLNNNNNLVAEPRLCDRCDCLNCYLSEVSGCLPEGIYDDAEHALWFFHLHGHGTVEAQDYDEPVRHISGAVEGLGSTWAKINNLSALSFVKLIGHGPDSQRSAQEYDRHSGDGLNRAGREINEFNTIGSGNLPGPCEVTPIQHYHLLGTRLFAQGSPPLVVSAESRRLMP